MSKALNKSIAQSIRNSIKGDAGAFLADTGPGGFLSVTGWIPISFMLDRIITMKKDTGGIPLGRLTEINGHESIGKTALLYMAYAWVQSQGGLAVHFDFERSHDPERLAIIGGDPEDLILFQTSRKLKKDKSKEKKDVPDNSDEELETKKKRDRLCLEDCFEFTDSLIRSATAKHPGIPIIIGVDSVNQAATRSEVDKKEVSKDGTWYGGDKPQLLEQGLRKITGLLTDQKVAFVWVNHLKEKIGSKSFIKEWETSGGKALKFYSSLRIQMTAGKSIYSSLDKEPIGNYVRLQIVKTRFGPPRKSVKLPYFYRTGRLNDEWALMDYVKEKKVGKQEKGLVIINDHVIHTNNFCATLRDNPKIHKDVENAVWGKMQELEDQRNSEIQRIMDGGILEDDEDNENREDTWD